MAETGLSEWRPLKRNKTARTPFGHCGKTGQFVEKALLFHKLCAYFKWKRGLAPFSKPFSPCNSSSF